MSDRTALIITVGVVITISWLIYRMDKTSKEKGGLFTQPTSKKMRILAFFLGLILFAVSALEVYLGESVPLAIPLAAIALFAYCFGASDVWMKITGEQSAIQRPAVEQPVGVYASRFKIFRLLLILVTGITGIVAAIYGCLWILGHADAGRPFIIALIIMAISPVGQVHGVVLLIQHLLFSRNKNSSFQDAKLKAKTKRTGNIPHSFRSYTAG